MKYSFSMSTCQIHMSIFQITTYLINCSITYVKSSVIDLSVDFFLWLGGIYKAHVQFSTRYLLEVPNRDLISRH